MGANVALALIVGSIVVFTAAAIVMRGRDDGRTQLLSASIDDNEFCSEKCDAEGQACVDSCMGILASLDDASEPTMADAAEASAAQECEASCMPARAACEASAGSDASVKLECGAAFGRCVSACASAIAPDETDASATGVRNRP